MVQTDIFHHSKPPSYVLLGHPLYNQHCMKFLLFQMKMKTNNFFENLVVDSSTAKWAKLAGLQAINIIKEKYFLISEKRIVPAIVLLFALVYWFFGIFCYQDIIKTY